MIGPVPVPVIIFLTFAVIAFIVLRYTRYGRHIYAVGGNQEAARLSGLKYNLVDHERLRHHRLFRRTVRLSALVAAELGRSRSPASAMS